LRPSTWSTRFPYTTLFRSWEHSTMEVAIGNRDAKAFKNISQPFAVSLNKEAKWNSLAIWDEGTVVALSSTNFASDKISPWLIKGDRKSTRLNSSHVKISYA